MDKAQRITPFLFLLLGIILAKLYQPDAQIQAFLFQYIPPQWGHTVEILILIAVFVGLYIWYWRLTGKSSDKIDLLIEQHKHIIKLLENQLKEPGNKGTQE